VINFFRMAGRNDVSALSSFDHNLIINISLVIW